VLLQPELGGWVRLPINWVFDRKTESAGSQPLEPGPSIPAIRTGDPLDLLPPYYPEGALARHEHGICKMHVTVSAAGDVDSIEVTQSTGSSELDQACLDAIYDVPFLPATREGMPVVGTTDVVLNWRLPVSEGQVDANRKGS
jgi:TonB family protein